MDRASDSGSEGWGFESLRARQTNVARYGFYIIRGIPVTDNDIEITIRLHGSAA